MQKNILLSLAVGVLLLSGCSSTVHTIVAKDGRVTLTDERGGKVVGTWELKQVLSKEEKNTLRREGWSYEGVVHNLNGPDTYLLKRRINPPVATARPPFQPMFINTFGTNTSSDGTWRIGASETSVDFSLLGGFGDADPMPGMSWSSTLSPGEWKAKPGWFVFIESKSNVWAYDGDYRLVLNVETVNGTNSTGGAIYENGYPCAVPEEVLSRLSERKQKDLKASK
jgi:hypothetical protein